MLDELKEVLAEKYIKFHYDQKAVVYLTKQSDGARFGARELRKTIRKKVEDGIANIMITNTDEVLTSIELSEQDGELLFQINQQ